jgi:DIS3-like exonuclease 2
MLPRPLCEIACSLNENVERLAFSCIWRMNKDGSLVKGHEVWYGRTVIKSCARLDYATAQNIIDRKVAIGENEVSEECWPASRRPTGKHTIDEVAADVRLMHQVAMARRQVRFRNGAIALNAVKLTFQLDSDRETPLLCEPYPIRDSNRLVEEYMLLANYLVAQRLITHAGGKALLRNHNPPLFEGLEKVAEMASQTIGFHIDISSSESLQRSLNRLGRECSDELALTCITEMLKLPMQAAEYVTAGTIPNDAWSHFALNIPYYTHFTSPIRRYADVIVHRLLQATIEGKEMVDDFVLGERDIQTICERCNEKKEGSRKAQERSDMVFLALYLRRNPMKSKLGIVLSVGQKAFTVFVPSLGISTMLFLDEHTDWIKYEPIDENDSMGRRIKLERISKHNAEQWKELIIRNFVKVRISCKCHDKPPISVKLELEGPWTDV